MFQQFSILVLMTEPQLLLGFSQRFLMIITFHNLQTCLHLSRMSKSSRPSNSIMPLNKRSGSKSQFGFNEFTDALILNTFPSTFCQIILVGIVFNSFTFDSSRFPSLHSCVSSSTVAAVQVQCYCYRAGMDECENRYITTPRNVVKYKRKLKYRLAHMVSQDCNAEIQSCHSEIMSH